MNRSPRSLPVTILVSVSTILVASWLASAGSAGASPEGKGASRGAGPSTRLLDQGSIVALRTKKPTPLSKILEYIEKKTGNRVEIVNEYGGPAEAVLNEAISMEIAKKPFWEAVRTIEEETSTRFRKLEPGVVELTTDKDPSVFEKDLKPAGEAVVQGAFFLRPRNEIFFKRFMVSVRPEPVTGGVLLGAGELLLRPKDGKPITLVAQSSTSSLNVHSGELDVVFQPKSGSGDGEKLPRSVESADLQLQLAIPQGWKEMKLGTLGSLINKTKGQSFKAGSAKLKITKAEVEDESSGFGGEKSFTLEIEVEGVNISPRDLNLLDAKGDAVKSYGQGQGGGDTRVLTRMYMLSEFTGSPLNHQLAIRLPSKSVPYTLKATLKDLRIDFEK